MACSELSNTSSTRCLWRATGQDSPNLVDWEQQYNNLNGPYGIWGRVVFDTSIMHAPVVFAATEGGMTNRHALPALAGGRSKYLAVWEHDHNALTNLSYDDMHGRLLRPYMVALSFVMH